MNDGIWTWTCSACGRQFARELKHEAQDAFNAHATQDHNAKIVLSAEAGGGHRDGA